MAAIQLLSIPEIMGMAKGSVDIANKNGEVDWWGIFSAKVSAGHFDTIVDEIATNGFGMPIVLCDRYYDGEYAIGNGHHRLCAAILLGLWRIPVIIAEGGERDDFMQKNDSMDDDNRPIDYAGTYDYWEMLQGNMESSDYNDYDDDDHPHFYCEYSEAWHNNSTDCCQTCHYDNEHPLCSVCEQRECCTDHFCDECGMLAVSSEDHAIACSERDYELVYHWNDDCDNHYRFSIGGCALCANAIRDDADDENAQYMADRANLIRVGAMYPDGAWHPASVLADAYAADAAWEADAPLREARAYWDGRVSILRAAVLAGHYSDDYLSICAVDVAEARAAYMAL